jgi:hypothetical protein
LRGSPALKKLILAAWLVLLPGQAALAVETVYQSPGDFLAEKMPGCEKQVLWMSGEIKSQIQDLIGHPYPGVRVRFCQKDGRTAWILDEIGKTEPITSGIIVNRGRVERVDVLVFRESRGSEVHRSVFTRQYQDAGLDRKNRLDRHIDGITGATLSVYALTRQVKLALLLDQAAREDSDDD